MKRLFTALLLLSAVISKADEPSISNSESKILVKAQLISTEKGAKAAEEHIKKNLDEKYSAALDYSMAVYAMDYENSKVAKVHLQNALKKAPNFQRAMLLLAKLEYEAEKWDDAAKWFAKLIDSNYKNPVLAWKFLARSRYEQEQFIAAEAAFRQVLIRDVNDEPSQRALIVCLIEQNRLKEAKPLITKMLEKKPKDAELWNLAASIEIDTGNRNEALVKLATAEKLGVDAAELKKNLASLYFENELYDLSAGIFIELSRIKKLSEKSRIQAVEAFISINKIDIAEKLLTTAAHSERVQLAKIKILESKHTDFTTLKTSYEKLLKSYPLSDQGLLKFAQLLQREQDFVNAELYLKRAIRVKEKNRQAMIQLAQVYVDQEQYAKAISQLRTVLDLKEDKAVRNYLNQVILISKKTN
jgi:lipopolysaccharide biosynthesis regulator YciM